MSTTLISLIQPPNIDPSQAPTAFGRWAVPRFVRELQSPFLYSRQRALRALHDYLLSPEHVGLCYEAGLLDLIQFMYATEQDLTVRERCSACLLRFIQDERARSAMFQSDRPILAPLASCGNNNIAANTKNVPIIDTLLSRIEDDDERVRTFNHRTLYRLSTYIDGALNLLNARIQLPSKLVELLDNEEGHADIQCLILDCMHNLMQWDTNRFLAASAVPLLVKFCEHSDAEIRRRAMRCASDLAMPRSGKQEAVERGLVEVLIHALVSKSSDNDIRASALFGIAMLTILTPGKYRALQGNAVQLLIPYLDDFGAVDECSEIKLNAIKVLTCLAETPEGRRQLLELLDVVERLKREPNPHIRQAGEKLERVINWKP